MQIIDVHLVLGRIVAVAIRRSISLSALDSAACHPHGETMRVVVPPVPLRRGCPTELAPHNTNVPDLFKLLEWKS
jgi:hypothetical protein